MTAEPLNETIYPTMPRWVAPLLYAAAVYNIAWGMFIILVPQLPFKLAGMAAPNYPTIVQCLGMIVGVYGIGYAIAARDPLTQWPLVLVGLLGKVLGPVGFVYAATIGEFPWVAGVTIVTNDLIWWIPFAAILLHALRIHDARHPADDPASLASVLQETHTAAGESLAELSRKQDLLIVCLRHAGCTYCREALADLAQQRAAIREAGVRPIVVHMGTIEQGARMLQRYGCEVIDQVSDPTRRVYRALQLRLATFTELLGLRTFWRALVGGVVFRYGFGPFAGNGLQMPGAFIIRDSKIVKQFRHQSPADRPDYVDLACAAR